MMARISKISYFKWMNPVSYLGKVGYLAATALFSCSATALDTPGLIEAIRNLSLTSQWGVFYDDDDLQKMRNLAQDLYPSTPAGKIRFQGMHDTVSGSKFNGVSIDTTDVDLNLDVFNIKALGALDIPNLQNYKAQLIAAHALALYAAVGKDLTAVPGLNLSLPPSAAAQKARDILVAWSATLRRNGEYSILGIPAPSVQAPFFSANGNQQVILTDLDDNSIIINPDINSEFRNALIMGRSLVLFVSAYDLLLDNFSSLFSSQSRLDIQQWIIRAARELKRGYHEWKQEQPQRYGENHLSWHYAGLLAAGSMLVRETNYPNYGKYLLRVSVDHAQEGDEYEYLYCSPIDVSCHTYTFERDVFEHVENAIYSASSWEDPSISFNEQNLLSAYGLNLDYPPVPGEIVDRLRLNQSPFHGLNYPYFSLAGLVSAAEILKRLGEDSGQTNLFNLYAYTVPEGESLELSASYYGQYPALYQEGDYLQDIADVLKPSSLFPENIFQGWINTPSQQRNIEAYIYHSEYSDFGNDPPYSGDLSNYARVGRTYWNVLAPIFSHHVWGLPSRNGLRQLYSQAYLRDGVSNVGDTSFVHPFNTFTHGVFEWQDSGGVITPVERWPYLLGIKRCNSNPASCLYIMASGFSPDPSGYYVHINIGSDFFRYYPESIGSDRKFTYVHTTEWQNFAIQGITADDRNAMCGEGVTLHITNGDNATWTQKVSVRDLASAFCN